VLVKHLAEKGYSVDLAGNPARTGYTTDDLIRKELPVFDAEKPDIVTLLIGVNDYVRGKELDEFRCNLVFILDHLQKGMKHSQQIVLIAIPDYSVTPGGKLYASGRDVSEDLREWNDEIRKEAQKRKLPFVDIFPLTQRMGEDRSLTAADGLHPSAKEVALWEEKIFIAVVKIIEHR
jgi:lysophospholipase L1-like esterase